MQSIKSGKLGKAGEAGDPLTLFNKWLTDFHQRYRRADRQLKLTDDQEAEFIQSQEGKCAVSGAPIFVGDDVAVDHKDALATGRADALENLQITTSEANLRKGPRPS